MKMLPTAGRLTQCVTMARIRGVVNTGCIADQQLIANSQNVRYESKTKETPEQKQDKSSDQHADADSAVWRDRISAKIKMAATPEARSLSSL